MLRILEDRPPRPNLDDLAEIHHGDAVADPLHDRHVVRNKQIRQAELRLKVEHQIDDLSPDRHVQRRHRFVGDDDLGLERERARDGHSLPLSAGKLVRITLRRVGRQSDMLQQPRDPLLGGSFGDAVDVQRLRHRKADSQARIERGVGVLEDHLDLAPQRPHFVG